MKITHHDTTETIKRLRKHPVWTMDAQNVTADAADHIEELKGRINRTIHYLVAVPFVEQGNAYGVAIDILTENHNKTMRNETLLQRHTAQTIELAQAPEPQQLSKQEENTLQNLKTGLAIFLLLALIGAALDLLV